jgi:membrane associated rhomboid family serine protease
MLAIGLQEWSLVYRNFFSVIGAVFFIEGIWQYARSRQYSMENAASDASTVRFTAWIKKKSLSGYTVTLAACIVVVSTVQVFPDDAIKSAGLVKPAVRDGEIWRLFTATLMHANLNHFLLNFLALLHFSRIIEQTVQRAYVPLVFVLTAPVGSIFSVLFYPNSTSIGASGGLMGLLGFITMAAYFERTRYPPRYVRQMIETMVMVGVFGLVGFAFVDNAAHLGGLVSGLFFGWFFLRKTDRIKEKEKLLKLSGVAALSALGVISAIAVYRMTF